MKRRSIIASLALCGAIVFSLGNAPAVAECCLKVNGKYVVYVCYDQKPHDGPERCPEDRRFVYGGWFIGQPPPK